MDQDGRPGGDEPVLPAAPSGRVPQWVLDEAAGFPGQPIPWRAPPPSPPRRRGPGAGARALAVLVLLLAFAVGAVALAGPGPWLRVPPPVDAAPTVAPEPPAPPRDRPTGGLEEADAPRGIPLDPPAGGGPHGFVAFQADGVTPVAYDPCRPIHYVLRPEGAPAGGEDVVRSAIARMSEATGLEFIGDGTTDEASTRERPIYQPDRYGDRWAPVLIAWETEAQNPDLAGDTVGEAGSVAVSLGDGPRAFVTGTVSLDADRMPEILAMRDGEETARAIVLHELGHLVGLTHVDDRSQLMYPETRGQITDFAAGDLTGLAALGRGTCVPEL
jgi:Matrixin